MVSTGLGMRSNNGVAATPFTQGPYSWSEQLTWNVTQAISDLSLGGNSSDELRGVVINATLAQLTPSGVAGARVLTTTTGISPDGVGGAWADGFYAEVREGTTGSAVHATTGYISGGEFQTTIRGTFTALTWAILTLNSSDLRTGGGLSGGSYFLMREYGTNLCGDLFNFFDAAIGSGSASTLITTTADKAQTHGIKMLVGATTMWVMATTNVPS